MANFDTSKLAALTIGQANRYAPLLGETRARRIEGGTQYFDPTQLQSALSQYTGFSDDKVKELQDYLKDFSPVADVENTNYYKKSDVEIAQQRAQAAADPANWTYGLEGTGYTKQDTDPGRYNILGTDGSVLGTGYDDVRTAAEEMVRANAMKSLTPQDYWEQVEDAYSSAQRMFPYEYGNQGGAKPWDNLDEAGMSAAGYRRNDRGDIEKLRSGVYRLNGQTYDTLEAAQAAAQGITLPGYSGGALGDWEQLGQAINGGTGFSNRQEWGSLPLNGSNETISGENALYGSTPVFSNGKFMGYRTNLAPGEAISFSNGTDKINGGGTGYSATHSGRSHSWATGLGRSIDPSTYSGIASQLDGSNVFVPKGNASKLPGWTNIESYNHKDTPGNWGVLGQVFDFIDPILDKVDPIHNKVQEWTTGSKETAGQRPYFETIAPAIIDAFFPLVGTAISAVNSATKEDGRGVAGSVASLATPNVTGFDSAAVNAAATGALKAGVSSAIQSGGDVEMALKAALAGGLSGGLANGMSASGGNWMDGMSPYERIALQAAAKGGMGALTSELNGDDFRTGLTTGAFGSALGSLYDQALNAVTSNLPDASKMDPKIVKQLAGIVMQQLIKKAGS